MEVRASEFERDRRYMGGIIASPGFGGSSFGFTSWDDKLRPGTQRSRAFLFPGDDEAGASFAGCRLRFADGLIDAQRRTNARPNCGVVQSWGHGTRGGI